MFKVLAAACAALCCCACEVTVAVGSIDGMSHPLVARPVADVRAVLGDGGAIALGPIPAGAHGER